MDKTKFRLKKEKRSLGSVLIDIVIKVSSPLVVIASVVLLVFVFFLTYFLPLNEKEALIRKTDDFCISTAIGLSSATIESITGNKRVIVGDYLNDISRQNIQGLIYAEVIEYQWKKDKKNMKSIAGGKIIGSLKTRDVGKNIPGDNLDYLKGIAVFSKRVIENKSGNLFEYSYPVVWKTKSKGKSQEFLLGVIRLRFSERALLQSYYRFRDFSNQVAAGAAVASVIIVYFYLLLIRLLKKKINEIKEMSLTDTLTKISNRKKFNEVLVQEIRRSKRYHEELSLIMFDIDHFKNVNDTYGHDAGDLVLFTVAQIVRKAVRDTDLLARWGGEEFMILIPNTSGAETGQFADRIRQDIAKTDIDIVKHVTCSFGVTSFRESDSDEQFIKRADEAMYRSKENGRNRVTMNLKP